MLEILFLASNPAKTSPLQLGEEIRDIRRKIRAAAFREIRIEQEWAVRPADLITYLQEHEPTIVHFSGHGIHAGEIVLQDPDGASAAVAPDILADIFRVLQRNVRCVVLNACFSRKQAVAISQFVDCVVGMTRAVRDDAAIQFAGTFYETLANGRSIRDAFELGRAMMRVMDRSQGAVPVLLERSPRKADTNVVVQAELVCEFRIDKSGRPIRSKDDRDAFEIRAWIKDAPADTFCVVYQLDEEYHEDEAFNTVGLDESHFELYFDCAYDFEVRASLWRIEQNGLGLRVQVVAALERRYGNQPPPAVRAAIAAIRENID